jgi:uncharacterized membrane protein HdeD (DUF308 family)
VSYAEDVDGRTGRSPARVIIAVVLVIIAILLIIAGILYLTEPAHSLPSILGTLKHPPASLSRANNKRTLRGLVSLIVGLILLIGAGFAFLWKPKDR